MDSTGSLPFVIGPDDLSATEHGAVLERALVAPADVASIEVTGSGAVRCLQGMLTSDIETPGEGSFTYGATLTAKGMILCDVWVEREGGRAVLSVPRVGKDVLVGVLSQFLPPRLAKFADRSDDVAVLRVTGPRAQEVAAAAGVAVPEPGCVAAAIAGPAAVRVARPSETAPFTLQVTVQRSDVERVSTLLAEAGALRGSAHALELARILVGWPRLGTETDAKTLPQEVRLDEIGGVSYTKGCYTGQETVARVHFRGHPNRYLMGLLWHATPDPTNPSIQQNDHTRGRVTSMVWTPQLDRWIGLGVVRREIEEDQLVDAAGAAAEIVPLPFDLLT